MRKLPIVHICVLLLSLVTAAWPAGAAELTIILNSGGNSWRIVQADKVTFNQKEKIRVGSAVGKSLTSDQYHKMIATPVMQAGVIRRHADGYMVKKGATGWELIAPDGISLKGSSDFAALWSNVTASSQLGKNGKAANPLTIADVYAVLPGGDATAAAKFIADDANFRGLGEKEDQAFDERMSLFEAVAPTLTGEAADILKKMLLDAMQKDISTLSTGIAQYATLMSALRYVPVSEYAFPADDAQIKARKALTGMRDSLARRIAILKAMNAGEMWDALIAKYGDFERWHSSFEDLRKMREEAFKKSAAEHLAEADRLEDMKQYAPELGELRIADLRLPADPGIAARIEAVRAHVEAQRGTGSAKARRQEDPTSPEYRLVTGYLADADTYAGLSEFKQAETQLAKAEGLAKDSPRVLLARARLYDASKQPQKALETLDVYMASVSSEKEMTDGEALRSRIRLTLLKKKQDLIAELRKSEDQNDFLKALNDAKEGRELDPKEPDFLLEGAKLSAILRKTTDAQQLLNQYLSVSSAVNAAERAEVYGMLTKVQPVRFPTDGVANWFSGFKSSPGVFYCPASLAPGAPIAEVKGSRKQIATYEWAGGRLVSIHSSSQEPGEHPVQVYFEYSKDGTMVQRVGTTPVEPKGDAKEDQPMRFSLAELVQETKESKTASPVLANHPVIDPIMVERLIGKDVSVLVTGNPYFNPFEWSGLYAFLAHYDEQGRVVSASEIVEGRAPHVLEFKWDGPRLTEIAERGGAYNRKMSYSGSKLTGETISFQGRIARIEYKYNGDRLTSARSDEDPSLDNRSRNITFR